MSTPAEKSENLGKLWQRKHGTDTITYLRRSGAISPDALRHSRKRATDEDETASLRNERIVENYWRKKSEFFLYVMLLGNTVDGMPNSIHYSYALSGGVYNLVHLIGCFFLIMPMLHVELFFGGYTKLTNSQMYRMAPMFYGYCMLVLTINACYGPLVLCEISQLMLAAIKVVIHDNLYTCPPDAVECYDLLVHGPLNATCTRTYLGMQCDGKPYLVRYVTLYSLWYHRHPETEVLNWEYLLIMIITWLILMMIVMMGMKFIGNFLSTAFAINFVINFVLFLMSIVEKGSLKGVANMVTFNFKRVRTLDLAMSMVFTSCKLGLIRPCGYMTRAAYVLKIQFGSGVETMLLILLNYLIHLWHMLVINSVTGVMAEAMSVDCEALIPQGVAIYTGTLAQFLTYRGAPIGFISMLHISYWLVEMSKLSIVLHMLMLNINDCFPKLTRYKRFVVPMITTFGAIISIMFSFRAFIYYVIPLMKFSRAHAEQCFLFFVQSLLLFYSYGVNRICDDIHYMTGHRPITLWRCICYAYPVLSICLMVQLVLYNTPNTVLLLGDLLVENKIFVAYTTAMAVVLAEAIAMIFITSIYVIWQVHNGTPIVDFVKPQFYFGPPYTISRIGRKHFRPHLSTRSRTVQKSHVRYRLHSVRVEHRLDTLYHSYKGRVFLEDNYRGTHEPEMRTGYRCDEHYTGKLFAHLQKKYTREKKRHILYTSTHSYDEHIDTKTHR